MKTPYVRCPRCELNYILKKDKLCSVCKNDLESRGEYVDELSLEICPCCKVNYIQPDEVVCATCLKERQHDEKYRDMDDEEWQAYLNRDEENDDYSPDEETGDMASITNFDDDDDILVDDDLDFGDDEIDEDLEDEFKDEFDDENDDFDDDDDYDDFDNDDDDDED